MRPDPFLGPAEPGARFRTLELRVTVAHDAYAVGRLTQLAAAARGGTVVSFAGPHVPGDEGAGGSWMRFEERVWWAPPSRWRDESADGSATVAIVRGNVALVYVPGLRTLYTNEPAACYPECVPGRSPDGVVELPTIANRLAQMPLIRPPFPAGAWEFTPLAPAEILGRQVRRLRATRRTLAGVTGGHADALEGAAYWALVDTCECSIDDRLGILLRLTGFAGGTAVADVVAEEVRVDAPLTADTFAFVPPAGSTVIHVSWRG